MTFPIILPHPGIHEAIADERARQERLLACGKFSYTCVNAPSDDACLRILVEEVGEVAKALNEHADDTALRTELVQVAAVAVAWIERLQYREDMGK